MTSYLLALGTAPISFPVGADGGLQSMRAGALHAVIWNAPGGLEPPKAGLVRRLSAAAQSSKPFLPAACCIEIDPGRLEEALAAHRTETLRSLGAAHGTGEFVVVQPVQVPPGSVSSGLQTPFVSGKLGGRAYLSARAEQYRSRSQSLSANGIREFLQKLEADFDAPLGLSAFNRQKSAAIFAIHGPVENAAMVKREVSDWLQGQQDSIREPVWYGPEPLFLFATPLLKSIGRESLNRVRAIHAA